MIRAKLLYAAETLSLNPASMKQLDTLQTKILRRILGVPSTYIDRRYTHEYLYTAAGRLLAKKVGGMRRTRRHGANHKLEKYSSTYLRRMVEWAQVIMADADNNRAKQVSIAQSRPFFPKGHKRVGKPRKEWMHEVCKLLWK